MRHRHKEKVSPLQVPWAWDRTGSETVRATVEGRSQGHTYSKCWREEKAGRIFASLGKAWGPNVGPNLEKKGRIRCQNSLLSVPGRHSMQKPGLLLPQAPLAGSLSLLPGLDLTKPPGGQVSSWLLSLSREPIPTPAVVI